MRKGVQPGPVCPHSRGGVPYPMPRQSGSFGKKERRVLKHRVVGEEGEQRKRRKKWRSLCLVPGSCSVFVNSPGVGVRARDEGGGCHSDLWGSLSGAWWKREVNSEAGSPRPKSQGLWTGSSGRPRGIRLPCQLRGPNARAACLGGASPPLDMLISAQAVPAMSQPGWPAWPSPLPFRQSIQGYFSSFNLFFKVAL